MKIRPVLVAFVVLGLSVVVDPRVGYAAPPSTDCSSGVTGDVNGDGFAEVAVADRGDDSSGGRVHVFYGTASGLTASARGSARDDQVFSQSTPGVPGDPTGAGFGTATRSGISTATVAPTWPSGRPRMTTSTGRSRFSTAAGPA